jgi:hypothetical protein
MSVGAAAGLADYCSAGSAATTGRMHDGVFSAPRATLWLHTPPARFAVHKLVGRDVTTWVVRCLRAASPHWSAASSSTSKLRIGRKFEHQTAML